MGLHAAPNARAVRLHRPRRRAFTLIELLVALAIVAILGAVAYFTYLGYIKTARTAALTEVLGQIYVGILAYQAQPQTPGFPTDATNQDATNNTGAASYAALIQDLAAAGVTGLPATVIDANIIPGSWSYFPRNVRSSVPTPPSFTATAASLPSFVPPIQLPSQPPSNVATLSSFTVTAAPLLFFLPPIQPPSPPPSQPPGNGATLSSFTVTAQANGGNGHVLCMDPTHGVVDIGVGGQPATPGVTCQ